MFLGSGSKLRGGEDRVGRSFRQGRGGGRRYWRFGSGNGDGEEGGGVDEKSFLKRGRSEGLVSGMRLGGDYGNRCNILYVLW